MVFISLNGYFYTVFDYLDNHAFDNIFLYSFENNKLIKSWSKTGGRAKTAKADDGQIKEVKPKVQKPKKAKKLNIGVFTSKGDIFL